jgi:FkbM family methyltransferase
MFLDKYLKIFPHKNNNYINIVSRCCKYINEYSVHFSKCICYESDKDSFFFLINSFSGNTIIYNAGISDRQYFSEDRTLYKTLDQECLEKNITNIDFINIDVNGDESFVLKGAIEIINTWKPLIRFNSSMNSFYKHGIYPMDCINLLTDLGYIGFDNSDLDHLVMYCPNETLSILPKTIYTFWTGTNPMSHNRINCLAQLRQVSQADVLLIDVNHFQDYILQIEPLHPAFPYLSETHKADYLRCYFMHFYGGGYSDIKYTTGSWKQSFEEMSSPLNNKNVCGYKEIGPHGVPVLHLRDQWEHLIGGGCYICKPNTDFTRKWYRQMIRILDQKLDLLKANPSKCPQDCSEDGTGYPLAWQEILGRIFHQVCYEERDKISQSLPILLFHSYR